MGIVLNIKILSIPFYKTFSVISPSRNMFSHWAICLAMEVFLVSYHSIDHHKYASVLTYLAKMNKTTLQHVRRNFTTIMKRYYRRIVKKNYYLWNASMHACYIHENMSTKFSNMFNGELIVKYSMYSINALSLMINLP